MHSNTSDDTIDQIISQFYICDKKDIVSDFKNFNKSLSCWQKFINKNIQTDKLQSMMNLFIGMLIQDILEAFSYQIRETYLSTYYIAPIRANAERYYRRQNLRVDTVDFQGRNLPMLIANMTDKEKLEFSNWVNENFGFGVRTKTSEGHISINVIKENEIVNMADAGFGYSQVLPIITQLWILIYREPKTLFSREMILAIEQPELHLHPEMQANLIDLFAKCINVFKKRNKI